MPESLATGPARATPLSQLRRVRVALESGQWPADLRDWLADGIAAALAGEKLDRALGLVPQWGKHSYRRQEQLAARDARIRARADSDIKRIALEEGLSKRHIQRILSGRR